MKTVVLEVRSLDETHTAAARAMKASRAAREPHIGFASPELLWRVLTVKRWELLKALCGAGQLLRQPVWWIATTEAGSSFRSMR
jgi:predicted transcriptional regulator